MVTTPTATIAVVRRGERSAAMTIARSTPGSANMMSTRLITPSPKAPPRYPASTPNASPRPSPTRTTPTPALSEMRAPCTTRVRISLPNWSVPMMWSNEGGCSRTGTSIRIGFPVSAGPTTATRARTPMSTVPTMPLAPQRAIRRERRRDARAAATREDRGVSVPNPWVEESIRHVGGDIQDGEHDGEQQDGALHQHIVPRGERLDGEVADAGPGEHRFRDHRAAEQVPGLQRDHGHDRDERVRERVPPHQAEEPETLGARRAGVVLVQDLQQAAPHVPGQNGHRPAGQGHGGEDQMPERVPQSGPPLLDEPVDQGEPGDRVDAHVDIVAPGHRGHSQPNREDNDQHDPEPECRNGDPEQPTQHAKVVHEGAGTDRRH